MEYVVHENLAWNASVLPSGGPFPFVPTNPGDTKAARFKSNSESWSSFKVIFGDPPAKGEPIIFQTSSV